MESSQARLSDNDLTVRANPNVYANATANLARDEGRYYWEATRVGSGNWSGTVGMIDSTGQRLGVNSFNGSPFGESHQGGDTIGFLVDLEDLTVTFLKNNNFLGTSDISHFELPISPHVWFGSYRDIGYTFNFGATDFRYGLPSGYLSYDLNQLPPPPDVPTGLKATARTNEVQLDWDYQPAVTYNIYRNGVKINDSPVTGTTYIDTTGVPDIVYNYRITAVNAYGSESARTNSVSAGSMLELVKPTLTYTNLTDTTVRLEWDDVGNNFTVIKDGQVITTDRLFKFYDVTRLEPNTSYEFIVRLTDRHGRFIDSDPVTITTLPLKMPNPVITFSNVTHNSFTVSWEAISIADSYRVWINNVEQTFTGTTINYTGAEPDTIYNVRVQAINDNDSAITNLSTRTSRQPIPRINHAAVTPSTGTGGTPPNPMTRNLTYEPNDMVTAVRIYINGQLIGEFPRDVTEIEIDFADLQDALMADITIEPVDENGEPYNFKTPVTTTGNDAIDRIVGSLLAVWEIIRRSFLYMVLFGALAITLIVIIFFWIRRKFQGFFGKTKNFRGEMKGTKAAAYRASSKAKFDPPAFTPPKGGAKYKKRSRSPTTRTTRSANIERSPQQLQDKDKRYYQSFGTQQQTQQFAQKQVVNFNDQNQVIAFQERAKQLSNKRRNRK